MRLHTGRHANVPRFVTLTFRCHPNISRVPNTLFYNGQLVDGCTPAQRPALAPGLAPVCFLETQGGYQQYQNGSSSASNKAEAQAVVQVSWKLYAPCQLHSIFTEVCFGTLSQQLLACMEQDNQVIKVLPQAACFVRESPVWSETGCPDSITSRAMAWMLC